MVSSALFSFPSGGKTASGGAFGSNCFSLAKSLKSHSSFLIIAAKTLGGALLSQAQSKAYLRSIYGRPENLSLWLTRSEPGSEGPGSQNEWPRCSKLLSFHHQHHQSAQESATSEDTETSEIPPRGKYNLLLLGLFIRNPANKGDWKGKNAMELLRAGILFYPKLKFKR